MHEPYVMRISRTTVNKLGIKLYDKASAVVAELVANSYDADAENVTVEIPLGSWLATKSKGEITDRGLEISVEDDGHGMIPGVINDFYLKVGTDPRLDQKRGPKSLEKKRLRMGRKGIGKLAPFGICKLIEVESAGGKKTTKKFPIAHFTMKFGDINQETDADYEPELGERDSKNSKKRGTKVTLKEFRYRRTPDADTFHRQLARRFGPSLPDFRITVKDTVTGKAFVIGDLPIEIDANARIEVDNRPVLLEDGTELPVKGWVAYAKDPYKNVEIAGVRIYARGRLVSNTRDFGLQAGFTGEYTIRSYLVGLIVADWIDSDAGDDLILSGRQDILWSSEIGATFQNWGQELIRELGRTSWSPRAERTSDIFLRESNFEEAARNRFKDASVVESALNVARMIGRAADREALKTRPEYVEGLKELVLTVAPHKMIVDRLKEVESLIAEQPLEVIAQIFSDATIAETASLGQIARMRINSITKLEDALSPESSDDEAVFQKLLQGAPWLINSNWTVLQSNQSFKNMRIAFEDWYESTHGTPIVTTIVISEEAERRRADFIMLHVGQNIEIVEIKKPHNSLTDAEFARVHHYFDQVVAFLDENPSFKDEFPTAHVVLICDRLNLGVMHGDSYVLMEERGDLLKKTWIELLHECKASNNDFLQVLQSG